MGKFKKDALWTMVISYIGMVVGYVNKGLLFLLLFTTEEIGLVNLLYSVGILLAQFSNLGAVYSIWKFFPFFRNKERQHYGFLLLNVLLVTLGVLLISLLLILFRHQVEIFYWNKSELFVEYYSLIFPIGIATVFFILFENYMRALGQNIIPVFLNEFVLRIVLLLLLGCFWLKWIDFNTFLYLFAVTHFIPTLCLLVYLMLKGELTLSLSSISIPKKFQKIILNFSFFNYLNSLGYLFVVSIDVVLLASFQGLKATGVYSMIVFLISAIQVPYRSLIRTMSPLVPIYWKDRNMIAMNKLYKEVSSMSLIMAMFLFSLIWINRTDLFSFLPPEYSAGIMVFFFLMVGRIIDLYSGLNSVILITSKKFKHDVYLSFLLILLSLTLSYLLIPSYGMNGAAIATAITIIIYNAVKTILVYKLFRIQPFEKEQLKVVLLCAVLLCAFEWFIPYLENRYIAICYRSILYIFIFVFALFRFKLNQHLIDSIKAIIKRFTGLFK